jgi:hypothetical protein
VKNRFQSLPFKCNLQRYTSAQSFPEDVARVFAGNLRRFRAGEPLEHSLDWAKDY